MRFLFQAHNRRGLGHLMRGQNIAREVKALAPGAEIMFYTRSPAAQTLIGGEFTCVVEAENDGENLMRWQESLRSFAADVLIYDTVIKNGALKPQQNLTARQVYIMRKCRPEKQQAIFADDCLDSIDLILLPHTREEFGYRLPDRLRHKSTFVGPIVRQATPSKQPGLRTKYGLNAGDFVLTSTVGGGGFTKQAQAFFKTVSALHQHIQGSIPNLRHIVVLGPNFDQSLSARRGMTLVEQEPDMTDLIAISDLVIAEGGYNTVNEIRLAKTPAVFLPSVRNLDDQEERVRILESAGLAEVFLNESRSDVAAEIAGICCDPARLKAMRQAYTHDHMAVGNRLAAEKLVALAQ